MAALDSRDARPNERRTPKRWRAMHAAARRPRRRLHRRPAPQAAGATDADVARSRSPTPASGTLFSGHPISLDFQGADLRAVLRVFAEISGLNIVIDPAVQGTVDVALSDVPWDQALDIILRANKLGYIVDGTIVRIAPLAVLADEENAAAEADRRAGARRRAASADEDAQLRQGRGTAGAADEKRAVAARHRAGRPADEHADHHATCRTG